MPSEVLDDNAGWWSLNAGWWSLNSEWSCWSLNSEWSCFVFTVLLTVYPFSLTTLWYNRTGWLGVKHRITYCSLTTLASRGVIISCLSLTSRQPDRVCDPIRLGRNAGKRSPTHFEKGNCNSPLKMDWKSKPTSTSVTDYAWFRRSVLLPFFSVLCLFLFWQCMIPCFGLDVIGSIVQWRNSTYKKTLVLWYTCVFYFILNLKAVHTGGSHSWKRAP